MNKKLGLNMNRMRHIQSLVAIIALLCSGCSSFDRSLILASDLNNPKRSVVIGALGEPLCRFLVVHAIVVDGLSTRAKEYDGMCILNVTQVGNKHFKKPVKMTFIDKTGEFPNINNTYVGRELVLKVHETGSFREPPTYDDWSDLESGQGGGYSFDTYLVVWKILSASNGK